MADFAPQRGGQPVRTVITVADLLGRRPTPTGVHTGGTPAGRAAVSVGALMRRERQQPKGALRAYDPTLDKALAGLTGPRRKLATSAGAVLAVGSLAGAAALLGHTVPGTGAGALDGGYPKGGVLAGPGVGGDGAIDGLGALSLPLVVNPAGLVNPLGVPVVAPDATPPAPATGAPVTTPGLPAPALTPAPGAAVIGGAAASSGAPGGLVGQSVNTTVSGVGGVLGNTVTGLGNTLGAVGAPVSTLGQAVSGATGAVGQTLNQTVGVVGTVGQAATTTLAGTVGGAGGAVGETVRSLGAALPVPVVGPVVQTLGTTVSGASKTLAGTVGHGGGGLVGGLLGGVSGAADAVTGANGATRSGAGGLSPSTQRAAGTWAQPTSAGSALSSLTKPIGPSDAPKGVARTVTGTLGSLLDAGGALSAGSSGRGTPLSSATSKFSSKSSPNGSQTSSTRSIHNSFSDSAGKSSFLGGNNLGDLSARSSGGSSPYSRSSRSDFSRSDFSRSDSSRSGSSRSGSGDSGHGSGGGASGLVGGLLK